MSNDEMIVELALSQVGYEEPFHDNRQKYGAYLDQTTWYEYKEGDRTWIHCVNGYDWCTQFHDWCHVTTWGVEKARQILNRPRYNNYGAVVKYTWRYYNEAGWIGNEPKKGASIFFQRGGELSHIGIVVDYDETYVYTVEGNAGPGSYAVVKNKYKRTDPYIDSYGYPDYAESKYPVPPFNAVNTLKGVAIRSGPYSDCPIVGYIALGSIVEIEKIAGSSGDFGKITGYVYLPGGFDI